MVFLKLKIKIDNTELIKRTYKYLLLRLYNSRYTEKKIIYSIIFLQHIEYKRRNYTHGTMAVHNENQGRKP